MFYDEKNDRFVMNIPDTCPKCGEELEIDYRYGKDDRLHNYLICPNPDCTFEEDFTEEAEHVQQANSEFEQGDE